VVKAEDTYTALLTEFPLLSPGAHGTLSWAVEGRTHFAGWQVRANAVWRCGRVFLTCPRCGRRCTRLYLPLPESWLACRRCWGLTYSSRTLLNYKDSPWGRGMFSSILGTTQRDWAFETTAENRSTRSAKSQERWAKRK
jgi:hypothetical protein